MKPLIRRVRKAAATALILAPLSLAVSAPTSADAAPAGRCNPVIDNANILDDADIDLDGVEGANIHVVTYTKVKGASLDAAVFDTRNGCPDWRGANGGWGGHTIVYAVSLKDRLSGVYYGPGFEDRLGDGRWQEARTAMGGYFADGNFTAGINASIAETNMLVTAPETTDSGPTFNIDVPWNWVLGIPLAIAAFIATGYARNTRRRRRKERTQSLVALRTEMDAAATLFMELENDSNHIDARIAALPTETDPTLTGLREDGERAKTRYETAFTNYSDFRDQVTAHAIKKMDAATLAAAVTRAGNINDQLARAKNEYAALDGHLDAFDLDVAEVPTTLNNTAMSVAAARALFPDLTTQGFMIAHLESEAADIEADIQRFRDDLAANKWVSVEGVATVESSATDLASATQLLPALREDTIHGIDAAKQRFTSLDKMKPDAERALATLHDTYDPDCVAPTVKEFNTAPEWMNKARVSLDAAEAAADQSEQDYEAATDHLREANNCMDYADTAYTAPQRADATLATVAKATHSLLDKTRNRLDQLVSLMDRNREAMQHMNPVDINAFKRDMEVVRSELSAQRPNVYFLADRVADVDSEISEVIDLANRTIRQYEKAQDAIKKAERAVRDAASKSRRSNAGTRSKSLARDADEALNNALAAGSLAAIISYAESATSTARSAESAATSAINAASSSSYGGGGGSDSFGGGGGGGGSFDGGGGSGSW